MKIYIGADHNGWQMKNELREWLIGEGYEVEDMGPAEFAQDDDYPDYGFRVAEAVAADSTGQSYGILLCGSGVGMSVVADKVKGIRAAVIHNVDIAKAAQRDDDINVLALGALYIDTEKAKQIIQTWLSTTFSKEERHVRRVGKIQAYEESK